MGKIDDNGTMRDPSTEEQTSIDVKIGGGIGQPYELLFTKEITTPTKAVNAELGAYDDVLICVDNAKGSANKFMAVSIRTTKNDSKTPTVSQFFNTSEARSCSILWERISEKHYLKTTGGFAQDVPNIVSYAQSTNYSDKIKSVHIQIDGDNTITQGTITIYGRNRM